MFPELRALLDKQEIYEVVARYARGADRLDWTLVASCFHDDGLMDASFWERPAHEEYADRIAGTATGHIGIWADLTAHYMMNCLIELDGDTADVETYCIAFHRSRIEELPVPLLDAHSLTAGAERDIWMGIRYLDRFSRRAGTWRISKRTLVFEWARVDPVNATMDISGLHRGRRDKSDLVYVSAH